MVQISSEVTKNVVLVHGGFVDGSGWEDVYKILKSDGYKVSVVQNPTITLTGDVVATRAVLDAQDGSAVLVGHSYGGVVITEAGNHPKVDTLVYITAFAPDAGESVGTLIANPAPGAPVPPILPPVDGFLMLDKAKFPKSFAGDVALEKRNSWELPSALGIGRSQWSGYHTGVENQGELVPGCDRGQDDTAAGTTIYVPTRRFNG